MSENVVTMVFTDLVSSTAIKLKLDTSDITESNRLYRDKILLPHRQRVENSIPAYGGRKVETIGDAFFLVFPNPINAVRWAVAIQMCHIQDPIPTPFGPLQITIGIHTGCPLEDGDRFIGHEVDYAARVASLVTAEQILVSEVTAVLVREGHINGVSLHRHGDRDLKGIGSVPIFEILYNNKQPQPLKDNLKPQELKKIEQDIPIYKKALKIRPQTENSTGNLSEQTKKPIQSLSEFTPTPIAPVIETLAPTLTITPESKKQLQTWLAISIGPIALVLLEDAIKQATTAENLIERLAVHLPDGCRQKFQEQAEKLLKIEAESLPTNSPNQEVAPVTSLQAKATKNTPEVRVEPSFLQRCEVELAKYIGPMASFMIQQTLSSNPEIAPHQLVEILAKQISIAQKAEEFRQKLLS